MAGIPEMVHCGKARDIKEIYSRIDNIKHCINMPTPACCLAGPQDGLENLWPLYQETGLYAEIPQVRLLKPALQNTALTCQQQHAFWPV